MNTITSKLTRDRKIFAGTIITYLAVIAGLALTGHFTFFTKTALIPILFIVTFIAGRFVPFVKEWSVYISLIILFDAFRGYIFFLINKFQLPVWANYVITPEQDLLGGKIASDILQNLLYNPSAISAFDKFMTFIYGSHFAFFILFSFLIWFNKKESFNQFKTGILIVMYSGLLGYVFLPTIPPWIASTELGLLPELHIIYMNIYNTIAPELRTALDTNPIAAMPSLHSAFPFFITLVAFRHYKWKGIFSLIYTLSVFFSLVYGAQHYILDIAGGMLISFIAFYISYHSDYPAKVLLFFRKIRQKLPEVRLSELAGKLILSFIILILAEIAGQTTINYFESNLHTNYISEDFVKKELNNKSPMSSYYLGLIYTRKGDHINAMKHFDKASSQIPLNSRYYKKNMEYFAQTAFLNKSYQKAADTFTRLSPETLNASSTIKLLISHIKLRNISEAYRISEEAVRKFPENIHLIFLKCKTGLLTEKLTHKDILAIIKQNNEPDPKYTRLKTMLTKLINKP